MSAACLRFEGIGILNFRDENYMSCEYFVRKSDVRKCVKISGGERTVVSCDIRIKRNSAILSNCTVLLVPAIGFEPMTLRV